MTLIPTIKLETDAMMYERIIKERFEKYSPCEDGFAIRIIGGGK